ncbi:carboxypeptidase-like regulatory domain-containing protein [Mesoflavibacter sp. SCSIO 43206]|uniref:carboxypeptidase-like regulatory domain-containing protein n=1 Tax=Mesoflavibacter TaxID=444051 RepID=UPI001CA88E3C|nr:carboxypeptidase-like regulatory domain-containing protein [Mesoflavibacter sp. SCSIO 43206]UAB74665.1 carboxypeptidase-like regulatory domain-containing protein [Mesoflavibacter sp. SCSIO 43206]
MKKIEFNTSKALFLLLATFFFSVSYSQNLMEYKGVVLDQNNKKELALADVSLTNSNISTITNKEGEFSIKVPKNQLNESLIISFLGYKQQKVKLSEINNDNAKIYLEPAATILASVDIVRPKDAYDLVKKTLSLKGENYLTENAYMTGFYRESIKKRNRNASLAEAIVSIEKQPYTNYKSDKITLIKSRKQTNYNRLDTLALKLQGGPFGSLYADMIKYPDYVFNNETIKYYDFSFEQSTEKNGRMVYVVNFKQNSNYTMPLYYGKLYIDSQTYALTSADYNLNVENKAKASSFFVKKKPNRVEITPTEANYKVTYRVKNGKWYYSYSNMLLTFIVDWKGKLFNSKYTLNSEMAITDWNLDNNTISSNENKRLRPSSILQDEVSGFTDPEFWGEYNIIEPEKSIESAIRKISRHLDKS